MMSIKQKDIGLFGIGPLATYLGASQVRKIETFKRINLMSAEYRTVKSLSAGELLDGRLAQHGIQVEARISLRDGNGNFMGVRLESDGSVDYFTRSLGVDPSRFLTAIAGAFNTEVLDEDDPRFWGFASEEELREACQAASDRLSGDGVEKPHRACHFCERRGSD